MEIIWISAIIPNPDYNYFFFHNLIEYGKMTHQGNPYIFEIGRFTQVVT